MSKEIRDKLNQQPFEFKEEDWTKMEKKLDNKPKRRFVYWWMGAAAMLLVGLGMASMHYTNEINQWKQQSLKEFSSKQSIQKQNKTQQANKLEENNNEKSESAESGQYPSQVTENNSVIGEIQKQTNKPKTFTPQTVKEKSVNKTRDPQKTIRESNANQIELVDHNRMDNLSISSSAISMSMKGTKTEIPQPQKAVTKFLPEKKNRIYLEGGLWANDIVASSKITESYTASVGYRRVFPKTPLGFSIGLEIYKSHYYNNNYKAVWDNQMLLSYDQKQWNLGIPLYVDLNLLRNKWCNLSASIGMNNTFVLGSSFYESTFKNLNSNNSTSPIIATPDAEYALNTQDFAVINNEASKLDGQYRFFTGAKLRWNLNLKNWEPFIQLNYEFSPQKIGGNNYLHRYGGGMGLQYAF